MSNGQLSSVLNKLDAVKDTLTVKRVFGDAYEVGGTTIIPVAGVQGGGGGGGGEGPTDANGTPGGGGVGFGVKAWPVGVYIVKDGEVSWQPALDVTRVILASQLLGLVAILTVRKLLRRR
jgi:uncharacterized spore protein YtfJ